MKQLCLIFESPLHTAIEHQALPEPADKEVLVANRLSAISAGTEMLVFNGKIPAGMAVDTQIPSMSGTFEYPLSYGYSSVGEVVAAGNPANAEWIGRHVFAFQPHASYFTAEPDALLPLPDGMSIEDAVFLANMETAVNLVMDGRPIIGERVVVWGLGVVGLLTTAVLSGYPLEIIIGIDRFPLRRGAAANLGAGVVLSGEQEDLAANISEIMTATDGDSRPDLIYEVTGNPDTLNSAIACAGFNTRLVIGSWYGTKHASVDLGGAFHRNRIVVTSSQVSTIAPEFSARWTSGRRLQTAWQMLVKYRPSQLISHRFDIRQAQEAYELIARQPHQTLQVVFTYP